MKILRKILENKKNYYSLLAALLLGVFLIFLNEILTPDKSLSISQNSDAYSNNNSSDINNYSSLSYENSLEQKLEKTLSLVYGVGKVKVMITLESTAELVTKDDIKSENSVTSEEATKGDFN